MKPEVATRVSYVISSSNSTSLIKRSLTTSRPFFLGDALQALLQGVAKVQLKRRSVLKRPRDMLVQSGQVVTSVRSITIRLLHGAADLIY